MDWGLGGPEGEGAGGGIVEAAEETCGGVGDLLDDGRGWEKWEGLTYL